MSPEELEFIAAETSVQILPSVRMDKLFMIKDEYGPFRPQIRASVPLWLACLFRASNHCRIIPPEFLSKKSLGKILEAEQNKGDEFAEGLPLRYFEITNILVKNAPEDLQPDLPDILQLIQSIKEVRQQKILTGMLSLDGVPLFLRNVGSMELNQAKAVLIPAMNRIVQLNKQYRNEERMNVTKP